MINSADTDEIFRYHQSLIDIYGSSTAGAVGWTQKEGQQARFGMLSRIGDMNGCSVLDAGCEYADLFLYLRKKYPSVIYHGCEQMPELLNIAAQRHKGEKGITLYLENFMQALLPQTDYVLASGSLNYRHADERFIYNAISTLYSQCRLGLGFNLLSGGTDPGTLLASYDIDAIYQYCRGLSSGTKVHTGYWQDDFTVFVYR